MKLLNSFWFVDVGRLLYNGPTISHFIINCWNQKSNWLNEMNEIEWVGRLVCEWNEWNEESELWNWWKKFNSIEFHGINWANAAWVEWMKRRPKGPNAPRQAQINKLNLSSPAQARWKDWICWFALLRWSSWAALFAFHSIHWLLSSIPTPLKQSIEFHSIIINWFHFFQSIYLFFILYLFSLRRLGGPPWARLFCWFIGLSFGLVMAAHRAEGNKPKEKTSEPTNLSFLFNSLISLSFLLSINLSFYFQSTVCYNILSWPKNQTKREGWVPSLCWFWLSVWAQAASQAKKSLLFLCCVALIDEIGAYGAEPIYRGWTHSTKEKSFVSFIILAFGLICPGEESNTSSIEFKR